MLFEGKKILITGGTGSLGNCLIRRMLNGCNGTPDKIVVFSRDEAKQHYMRLEYMKKPVSTDEVIYDNFRRVIQFRIGDVRNYNSVCAALDDIDIVIHAAALKQVPSCEYFVEEAFSTNVVGAQNIVTAIKNNKIKVKSVVGISTDKACKPVNSYGMTKALQERILTSANIKSDYTSYFSVRYGNVLASRGSVIPLFHQQISCGGPLTVTTYSMTRFFFSLDEAVDTVFAAIALARPGDIFIPNIPSFLMTNIAKALIGDREIKLTAIGIRPGEKEHEELVSDVEAPLSYKQEYCVERAGGTANKSFYTIMPMLPELQYKSPYECLKSSYSSDTNTFSYDDTVNMLRDNDLFYKEKTL